MISYSKNETACLYYTNQGTVLLDNAVKKTDS